HRGLVRRVRLTTHDRLADVRSHPERESLDLRQTGKLVLPLFLTPDLESLLAGVQQHRSVVGHPAPAVLLRLVDREGVAHLAASRIDQPRLPTSDREDRAAVRSDRDVADPVGARQPVPDRASLLPMPHHRDDLAAGSDHPAVGTGLGLVHLRPEPEHRLGVLAPDTGGTRPARPPPWGAAGKPPRPASSTAPGRSPTSAATVPPARATRPARPAPRTPGADRRRTTRG